MGVNPGWLTGPWALLRIRLLSELPKVLLKGTVENGRKVQKRIIDVAGTQMPVNISELCIHTISDRRWHGFIVIFRLCRNIPCNGVGICGFGISSPRLYSISFTLELLLHNPKSEALATSRLHLTLALWYASPMILVRISHLAPLYVLAARFGSISCLVIVVIRKTPSCNKASNLSLV